MSMSVEDAGVERAPKPVPDIPDSVFSQLRMDGRVVAITGGADGIGLAVAEAMAEAGANVALWYNSNKAAIERSKELEEKYGIKSKAYQVEVSDHEAVEKTMAETVKDFGKLNCFVANAGMAISKTSTEQTIEEYRKQMSVNRKQWSKFHHLYQRKLKFPSRRCLLLRKTCRRHLQESRIWQPHHHIQHFGTHSERSSRPACKLSSRMPFCTLLTDSPLRYTTPQKQQ